MNQSLPLEIIEQIFQYLPIPTDELLGKGDGGMAKWKELQDKEFVISSIPNHSEYFDQLESKEFSKIIQYNHTSFESLVDCYQHPPYFPSGMLLTVSARDLIHVLKYKVVKDNFRIAILETLRPQEAVLFKEIFARLDIYYLKVTYADCLSYLGVSGLEQFSFEASDDPSILNRFPIKRLGVPYNNWGFPIRGPLLSNLEDLFVNLEGYEPGPVKLDLRHLNLQAFQIFASRGTTPPESIELLLPECLEELSINAKVGTLVTNFPKGLKSFVTRDYDKLDISKLPVSLEKLDFTPNSGSFSRLSHLKELLITSAKKVIITDLPPSLEVLSITHPIQMNVDFTKLPNLRSFHIKGGNFHQIFPNFVAPPGSYDNRLCFIEQNELYSVPFHENLSYMCIKQITDPLLTVCYPQSLRLLQFRGCDDVKCIRFLPPNLKGLKIFYADTTEGDFELPPTLEFLDLTDSVVDEFYYGSLKHLFLHSTRLCQGDLTNDLVTLSFIEAGDVEFPARLDLSKTRLSKFTYKRGVDTSNPLVRMMVQFGMEVDDPDNPKFRVILPSTTRLLDLGEQGRDSFRFNKSRVKKKLLREI
ncbi:hypothetical protein CLIB1444_04S05578 [[Candida] jaroonii]|uniref:Uncharacterized protein n=1 Tax=[Candida] jaroonii TaxID=467808 RepID=A0ACA9Y7N8_9ASCO|nr:hypothetical protein CLIB1444_04S05578 [[Candida] jaroonii]